MTTPYIKLDKNQAAVLLLDHQTGLLNLVQNFQPHEFKNNVMALADIARYFKLPTVLSTSFEQGPNGPLMPEIRKMLPKAAFIPRPGQINAWDNPDFVKAVKAAGKKQLIIAGIVTDICVAFPALSAIEEGFDVFVVTDACGALNREAHEAALMRMTHAGAQMLSWFAVAAELHRDWRNDVEGLGNLLTAYIPNYRNLMDSYASQQKKAA